MATGTALATIIIFFALGYHSMSFNWWGNTVGWNTADAKSVPWLTVPKEVILGEDLESSERKVSSSWFNLRSALIVGIT
jgi:hypothetical protein